MERKVLVAALIGLALGVVLGFWIGRAALEAKWSEPMSALTQSEATRLTAADSNPVPKAGTKILAPMPLGRARVALNAFTVGDPLVVTVGSVSNGANEAEGSTLHLRVENRGDCDVKRFSGVAYGFRSDGRSSPLNEPRAHFAAFSFEQAIARKQAEQVEAPLKHVEMAAVLLAQIDDYECANGKKWSRN